MQGAVAVFLITLGLGQLSAAHWRLRGISLVGANPWMGYAVGGGLLVGGALMLPSTPYVLLLAPLAGLLAVPVLLLGGSYINPPPHPDLLFAPEHAAHSECWAVQIPDGDDLMPGVLLHPPLPEDVDSKPEVVVTNNTAVCIVPGAGANKTFFKWRMVQALLGEGFTVLTIDPHGHGDYRHRSLVYPDCLSIIPAAVGFLQAQPGIRRVAIIGVSLGGATAISSIALNVGKKQKAGNPEALVVVETPVCLNYTHSLYYREAWQTFYGSPVLSLLREITFKQIRESWISGGYRSRHNISDLFTLLDPVTNIKKLKDMPIMLVYSRRDAIAPPSHAKKMQSAVPHATLIESKKASHVTLTLIPEVNHQIAAWLKEALV